MNTARRTSHFRMLLTATAFILVISIPAGSNICRAQTPPSQDHQRSWHVGASFAGGMVPSYTITNSYYSVSADEELQMYSFGLEIGKLIGKAHGGGILQGKLEMRAEVIPLWIARYPSQRVAVYYGDGSRASVPWKGQSYFGSSLTPLLARWNFNTKTAPRYVPWVQVGAGVLWTDHKFPITMWAAPASVFNFTPQVGAGLSVFHHSTRSIDLGLKVVHISNAGLGDSNPAINQTIMGSIGYSWWR